MPTPFALSKILQIDASIAVNDYACFVALVNSFIRIGTPDIGHKHPDNCAYHRDECSYILIIILGHG